MLLLFVSIFTTTIGFINVTFHAGHCILDSLFIANLCKHNQFS